jgi:hypothetical protein
MTIHASLACIVLAAAQSAGSVPAQEPMHLRWQLEPGEVLRYRATREQECQFDAGSMHRKGSQTLQETFSLKVLESRADGTARAEVTFEALIADLDRDDGLDATFDSVKAARAGLDVDPFFEENAAQLGRSRIVSIAADGTCSLVGPAPGPESVDSEEPFDLTGWTCSLPEGARLPAVALAPPAAWETRQTFEALFAIEHGLMPWTVTATCGATPGHAVKTQGLECESFDLEARFALATDEREIADGLVQGHVLEEPGKGRGSLVFARAEGLLVRFELEGSTTAYTAFEEGQRATRSSPRIRMRNRMRVELLERRPPPR